MWWAEPPISLYIIATLYSHYCFSSLTDININIKIYLLFELIDSELELEKGGALHPTAPQPHETYWAIHIIWAYQMSWFFFCLNKFYW